SSMASSEAMAKPAALSAFLSVSSPMALLTHSPGEAFPARPGFGSPLSLPITRDCELATSHLARRGCLASSKIWKYFVIALHPKRGEHSFLSCWRYVEPRAVNAGRVVNAVTPRW